MTIEALLWDFGDTLADERWMLAPMAGVPRWPAVYRQLLDGTDWGDRWNTGAASSHDVASAFGTELGVAAEAVHRHMVECSRNVRVFSAAMEIARRRHVPQAIVTINPDIFSDVVVASLALTGVFDVIVTSWERKTLSKADLCDAAIARLGAGYARDECLLIDNRVDCVAEWTARGGKAYRYVGDDALSRAFPSLLAGC